MTLTDLDRSPTEALDFAMIPGGAGSPTPLPTGVSARPGLLADRSFWAVLLIWALCWGSWAIALERFAGSLPWVDEYVFVDTGVATGEKPLSWEFLWNSQNEHRAPLLRLWMVMLGRAFHWDFRPIHQVNLGVLALGCLTLIFALRAMRGCSAPCDAFLPLLMLSSAHLDTLLVYSYAYAPALAVWCALVGGVLVKWPRRSLFHLFLYVVGALLLTWSGGPPGNIWSVGLCVPLVVGCFQKSNWGWKACALAGATAVAGSSAFLIYSIPPPTPVLLAYHSDSWLMTCKTAAKFSVGWMGRPVLEIIWPWALIVLLVPLLYLGVRFLVDLRRFRAAILTHWLDLAALLAASFLVTVAMAYGRAKFPGTWDSRYCALELPIAAILFLMLVRSAAPSALLNCLALGMAICVGWNWPNTIGWGKYVQPQRLVLRDGLRAGQEPLSILADHYGTFAGWNRENGTQHLIRWLDGLRRAGISVFAKDPDLSRRCLLVHSDTGALAGSLHGVPDEQAVYRVAIQAETNEATAVYEVVVPATGNYKLCCRWLAQPNQTFAVSVDGGPVIQQSVPGGPAYVPCVLGPTLPLQAGTHWLRITWPGAGSRLDILELNPQRVTPG
jgi:hypothetical protein